MSRSTGVMCSYLPIPTTIRAKQTIHQPSHLTTLCFPFLFLCQRCLEDNARFPAFRNAMQRNATQKFLRSKKVLRSAYFFTQPQTPQRRLRHLEVLRSQIETSSIFLHNAGSELDQSQSQLRLRSTNGCGTAAAERALRCVALRCVTE